MTTKLTTETFINQAQQVHNNKYDYSQTVYKHSKTKLTIICSQHGAFNIRPDNHLNLKQGCPVCGRESQAKTQSSKAKSEFVQKANSVHNNKYDYSQVEYINNKTLVKIICESHGQFEQTANNHLNGRGCPHCGDILRSQNAGWSRTKFKDKCIKNNNGFGILYVLGCWDDLKQEIFVKIGITSRSTKERYKSKASMPYNYKIIHEIVGSPEYIYDLETKLHKKSKNYKYIPTISFAGSSTECFIADKTYLNNLNSYISSLVPF